LLILGWYDKKLKYVYNYLSVSNILHIYII